MKRGSKVALIVAGALIVTGGAIAALAMLGANPIAADRAEINTRTYTAEAPVTSLGIDVGSGIIVIGTYDGDDVLVEYSVPERAAIEWEIVENGGALTVTQQVRPGDWLNSIFDFTAERAVIRLPESFAGDVTITSGSGSVTAGGFDAGTLAISGGSGSVELNGIDAQTVAVVGQSGSIRLTEVASADGVTVSGGSGSIHLSLVSAGGSLDIDNGSGSLRMDDVAATDIKVRVGSGSVRFDRLAGSDIRIDTGSGSVDGRIAGSEADYSATYSDSRGSHSHSSGGEGTLFISSGSGSVNVGFTE